MREGPDVSARIFGGVLPLSIGVVRWRPQNPDPLFDRVGVMAVNVLDSDHDGMKLLGLAGSRGGRTLGQDERARAEQKLTTVIADAEAFLKSELLAQPGSGCLYVRVRKLWNDYSIRYGTIVAHGCEG